MAQSNLIPLGKQKKKKEITTKNCKKENIRHFWTQRVYTDNFNPVTVFHYAGIKLEPLQQPKPNLKTISPATECDVTLLSSPKPALVNLIDGKSPHFPKNNVKVSNTKPIGDITADTAEKTDSKITANTDTKATANTDTKATANTDTKATANTDTKATANTDTETTTPATNTVEKPDKMAKKSKAKRLAALQARMQAAIEAAARAGTIMHPTPNAANNPGTSGEPGDAPTPNAGQPSTAGPTPNVGQPTATGPTANVGQPSVTGPTTDAGQPSETGPTPPKQFTNQQKKKWQKFQAKLWQRQKGKSVNLKWNRADAAAAADSTNEPGTSGTYEAQETSQDGSPVTPQASASPTAVITPVANPGSTIPVLENTAKKPSITLKTKKSLQQEMVKQRLNWVKPDPNVPAVPGTPLEMMNQGVPQDIPVGAPQANSARPAPGSTIPILENRTVEPTPRTSAGSFFKKSMQPVQPVQPPQQPRASLLDIYPYNRVYPKGVPRSFLLQQQKEQAGTSGSPVTADSPIWPTSSPATNEYLINTPTLVQTPIANVGDTNPNPPISPIFVQTETPAEVQQPYSPSDVYLEQGNNPEPPELELESSDQSQSGQKRLSAFQRLGPISQPKKPKLTINLNLKKDQPTREVVDDTDDDCDKYTPVHLRQDMLSSTDETVTMYLPCWPWRKNVAVRKSATARNSRSVMILEQEQMESAYEKENVFIQITVKGYPASWTKERVLEAVLDNVRNYSLIPCFTEFSQHECKFLVLRSRSALIVLHKTGFYIHKDGVELTLTISIPILNERLDFIPRIILRKRMVMEYADNKLNLKAFTLQDDISHFIYFPLCRVTNQSECHQLQSAISWDRLVELNLSHNKLTTISGFDLGNVTPRLKHLNLSHNCLEKVTVLLNDRQLPLKTIHLEGNPLCHDYIDPDHYVKVIRMMFPAVVEIDGVPIPRKGTLPDHKQNYCPEEAQEVTEKFLEIYFPLLDSGSDDRSLIQGMYDDDATLTVTYCYKLRYGQIYRSFRNLFLYARFLDEGEIDSVVGAMAITKLINRWPHTEHDPFTFTVDVLCHTETTTILRISGVLKLVAETLAEDEHLLSFTRTVVLHCDDGGEYKIHNEMVYWSEPTAAAARAAFRVNTISQKNFNLKIESTTDENLRDKFLKIFMKLTTMDRKISERCLEINNWNFKLALEHFTKLLKLNNLESLTQEPPQATS